MLNGRIFRTTSIMLVMMVCICKLWTSVYACGVCAYDFEFMTAVVSRTKTMIQLVPAVLLLKQSILLAVVVNNC